jgi:hypothetical protein
LGFYTFVFFQASRERADILPVVYFPYVVLSKAGVRFIVLVVRGLFLPSVGFTGFGVCGKLLGRSGPVLLLQSFFYESLSFTDAFRGAISG